MGLTLIHGKNQPSAKPRVFVVAEQSVHDALVNDLELICYFTQNVSIMTLL